MCWAIMVARSEVMTCWSRAGGSSLTATFRTPPANAMGARHMTKASAPTIAVVHFPSFIWFSSSFWVCLFGSEPGLL